MKATTLDDCFLTGCLGNRKPPQGMLQRLLAEEDLVRGGMTSALNKRDVSSENWQRLRVTEKVYFPAAEGQ